MTYLIFQNNKKKNWISTYTLQDENDTMTGYITKEATKILFCYSGIYEMFSLIEISLFEISNISPEAIKQTQCISNSRFKYGLISPRWYQLN